MERIILNVDSGLAEAWRKAPVELRQQMEKNIETKIAEELRLAEKDDFKKALKHVRQQAANNGLTKEILEELLREED
jgi:hypothetical protein